MMGAVINIGAEIDAGTMIDMGAILGVAPRWKNATLVQVQFLAGVIEPASAEPVRMGDNKFLRSNAVVIEGDQIGSGSVVGRSYCYPRCHRKRGSSRCSSSYYKEIDVQILKKKQR